LHNSLYALNRHICLIFSPLVHITLIIFLWPNLFSFGCQPADSLEFRLLIITPLAGGIGAQLDQLTHSYGYSLRRRVKTKKIIAEFWEKTIIGYIMGLLLHFFFHAGFLKVESVIDISNPYFSAFSSICAGALSIYIAPKVKNYIMTWQYYINELWQAIKKLEPPVQE